MKKILFVLLMVVSTAVGVRAQIVMGNTGLINIPTADMKPEGTFVGGATFLPKSYLDSWHNYNTGMYYITLTPLPWVELTFRETLQKGTQQISVPPYVNEEGALVIGEVKPGKYGFHFQDRSYSLRLAPLFWVKNKWVPKLVIGTNDPWSDHGGSYYSCLYGVTTETLDFDKIGKFGVSAGYFKSLNDRFGETKAYKGAFAGISYKPAFYDKLMVSADYDTKGVNLGANVILFNHWNIYAYERDFKKFGFGMSYQYTIDF